MHDDMIWHDACNNATEPRVMGYAIRTSGWRFVSWHPFAKHTSTPDWDTVLAQELYQHPASHATALQEDDENANLAGQEGYKTTVAALFKQLKAGWRAV